MIDIELKYRPFLHGCWPGLRKALEQATPDIVTDKGEQILIQSARDHAAYEKIILLIEALVNTIPTLPDQQFIDPNYEETQLKAQPKENDNV